mgnify:CR=1 FL=1
MFTLTGNTARVNREGTTGNVAWFMDDVVNLEVDVIAKYVERLVARP